MKTAPKADVAQRTDTVRRIADDLRAVGVRQGGVLMVHSSFSAMGHVPGGAETVILGLLDGLGPEGTLLMPALSYDHVTRDQPVFDVRRTPSNVGAIPEFFRTRPGTRRSAHPTHSACAIGPLADALLSDHHLDSTPCGPHSPFHRLHNYGGQVLMLGCGLRPNTSMHSIEEIVEPPYLLGRPLTYRLVLADGRVLNKTHRRHAFAGWVQRYDRVAHLLDEDGLKSGSVLAADVFLIEASALWDAVLAALRQDCFYFVEKQV